MTRASIWDKSITTCSIYEVIQYENPRPSAYNKVKAANR